MATAHGPIRRGDSVTLTGPGEEHPLSTIAASAVADRDEIERKLAEHRRAVAEARAQRNRQKVAAQRAARSLREARRKLRRALG